jgi:lysozyme
MTAIPQVAFELAKRFEGVHRVLRQDPGRAHPIYVQQGTGRLGSGIFAGQSTRRSP